MKIKFVPHLLYFLLLLFTTLYVKAATNVGGDTTEVKTLNRQAFDNRLTNPTQTIAQAQKALVLANKIGYEKGAAEANREIGIGYYYMNKPDSAIQYYLTAKKYYDEHRDFKGQSRVLNNIGNLYRETDFDRSKDYFEKALKVAQSLKDPDLIATAYLNLGNTLLSKKNYHQALEDYNKSSELFTKLGRTDNLIQCLQNKGVIYFSLDSLEKAKALLLQANQQAKDRDLHAIVAQIDITLIRIFTALNQFDKADYYWQEGLKYAQLIKNQRFEYDYNVERYQSLYKRKDWKGALEHLRQIYEHDKTQLNSNESTQLILRDAQYKQKEKEQENLHTIEQQRYARTLFIASSIVATLLAVVIFLLINNVNRKAKVNKHLTELNEQISEQKENLNQINHHLEEIIDERTKDLQVKNKKLADYSLHLSHQIRGPIATLKGLLNLERDKLIEQDECIKLMNKCVSDIDENIIDMSGMLHESSKAGANPKA